MQLFTLGLVSLTFASVAALGSLSGPEFSSTSGLYECDEEFGGQSYVGEYAYEESTYKLPGLHSITFTRYYDAEGNRVDEPHMVPGCEKVW